MTNRINFSKREIKKKLAWDDVAKEMELGNGKFKNKLFNIILKKISERNL